MQTLVTCIGSLRGVFARCGGTTDAGEQKREWFDWRDRVVGIEDGFTAQPKVVAATALASARLARVGTVDARCQA